MIVVIAIFAAFATGILVGYGIGRTYSYNRGLRDGYEQGMRYAIRRQIEQQR